VLRVNREEIRRAFRDDVERVALAATLDLLSSTSVFKPHEAVAMAAASCDTRSPHRRLRAHGRVGAQTAVDLAEGARRVPAMPDAAERIGPKPMGVSCGSPSPSLAELSTFWTPPRGSSGCRESIR